MSDFLLPLLSYTDLLLGPLYFILFLNIAKRWKRKYYNDSPIGKYIIPFFLLKMLCCVMLACLYRFYFTFSDADGYYTIARQIYNATFINPNYGIELLFKPYADCSIEAQQIAINLSSAGASSGTIAICKMAAFMSFFCFGTYLPIAFIFTFLAVIGTWRIFLVFYEEFPNHPKLVALGCLFAPSALFWGTNLLKDPICLFGLGLCVTALYKILKNKFRMINLVEVILGAGILLIIKNYIFYAFIVAALITIYITYMREIRNGFIKLCVKILLIITAIIVFQYAVHYANINGIISENLIEGVQNIQMSQQAADDGTTSAYTISTAANFSPLGIISSYFSSLNVTLFRPYFWEAKKLLVAGNALESFIILLLTLYLLFKMGIIGFFKFTFKNPVLLFALLFTLLLAPLVGFVSFNFGTLSRYKLPIISIFYTYLLVLYAHVKDMQAAEKTIKTDPQTIII
jgi:hypothetical protein